ncbi:MAG: hypothetical protein C0475_06710 [Planctomyces sp.]|nr:hypothetical protein [Planctomyces sp.]MBA4039437.1 hypothetical protein [Planctomyces sp.]
MTPATDAAPAQLAQAQLVHFLPILTTLISVAFTAVLLLRAGRRDWAPHLVWWAVGVFFYGVGTAVESTITLRHALTGSGNTPLLNALWFWAGAILGGYPLATGSLYLLAHRRLAHALTALSLAFVAFASAAVFLADMNAQAIAANPHRPSGRYFADDWKWVRLLTPVINIYAVIFLIGGAAYSCASFILSGLHARRAWGTGLIALGAILPGIGGSMAKYDIVEALYIGELLGLIVIWVGYEVCVRAPKPTAP